MITELQHEVDARLATLEGLSQEVTTYEALKEVNKEAAAALERIIESKINNTEHRMARLTWVQGSLFALFGAFVAIGVTVFADSLSHW